MVALSVGVPLLVLAPVLAFSIYIGLYSPDIKVLEWDKVVATGRSQVLEIVQPHEGETFKYFYSIGLLSFKEDGNLITDKRIVSYWEVDGELYLNESAYPDIVGYTVTPAKTWIDDTVVVVNHADADYDFELYLSAEDGMDKVAISYIKSQIQ